MHLRSAKQYQRAMEWFEYEHDGNRMQWPSHSPDLNPIKHHPIHHAEVPACAIHSPEIESSRYISKLYCCAAPVVSVAMRKSKDSHQ